MIQAVGSLASAVLVASGFVKYHSDKHRWVAKAYSENRPNIVVRKDLMKDKRYADIFRPISDEEVAGLQARCPTLAALNWLAFLGCYFGFYGYAVMGVLAVVIHIRWWLAMHDILHLRARLPEYYSLCVPILGFVPVGMSFKDVVQMHMVEHHRQSKLLLEPAPGDEDSVYSLLPFWSMVVGLFLTPSNAGWYDTLEQYINGSQSMTFLKDRAMSTAWLWLQLAVLHFGMDMLMPVLIIQHIGGFATFFLFNGCLHRKSFFKFLHENDPTGRRRVPYIQPLLDLVVGPGGWMEIKWHDVHHAFSYDVGCIETQVVRYAYGRNGEKSWEDIDRLMADMCDEGLYMNSETGEPISSLDLVGHEIGMRQRFLAKQK